MKIKEKMEKSNEIFGLCQSNEEKKIRFYDNMDKILHSIKIEESKDISALKRELYMEKYQSSENSKVNTEKDHVQNRKASTARGKGKTKIRADDKHSVYISLSDNSTKNLARMIYFQHDDELNQFSPEEFQEAKIIETGINKFANEYSNKLNKNQLKVAGIEEIIKIYEPNETQSKSENVILDIQTVRKIINRLFDKEL